MPPLQIPDPDPRIVLALAARAGCDVRTAKAYLLGRNPRGNILRARLRDASTDIGVERVTAPLLVTPPYLAA